MSYWFARLYDGFMAPLEKAGLARKRAHLLNQAKGNCLEIGVGTGVNFKYYPASISHLTVLDASDDMIEKAKKVPYQSKVSFVLGSAEQLPFADGTFDSVIATLVLCSIPNPLQALQEVKRVLKPNGSFIFMEHILAEDPVLARWQHRLNEPWRHFCDGCNLNRNTPDLIKQAGFNIQELKPFWRKIFVYGTAITEF